MVNGIEGCIGNTPLVRIKSLSDATGCEILGKAEFMNGAGGSPKDRVAARIIKEVGHKQWLVLYPVEAPLSKPFHALPRRKNEEI